MNDAPRERTASTETGPPEADRRRSRWPGWVWAIPLAALGFVGWLALRALVFAPPEVEVTFPAVDGISVGSPVRYKGVQVGRVDAVRLDAGLERVILTLALEDWMDGHLGPGTRFWIVNPDLTSGNVGRLLAGAYMAVLPGEDGEIRRFDGLTEAPPLTPERPGRGFILTAEAADGLSRGAPVRYRGLDVGRVLGLEYLADADTVSVRIFVEEAYAPLVRQASVFWRSGGVGIETRGGPSLELPSLATLTTGAVAFHTPDLLAGPSAGAQAVFTLYDSRAAALAAPEGPRFAYGLVLPSAAGGLTRGAQVRLDGRRVGRVAEVGLEIDPQAGSFAAPVRIELDPRRFGLEIDGDATRSQVRARLDELLSRLVAQGLRARLASGGPILGGQIVDLTVRADPPPGRFDAGVDPPRLPAMAGAAGLEGAVASIEQAAGRIGAIPFDAIARNLRTASGRVAALADAPEVRSSLTHLDSALASLSEIAGSAEGEVQPLMADLGETSRSIREAADALERLGGGTVRQNRDLPELVAQLTDAARAVESLARYLTRNPEALLQGREGP